jgi:GNAT superfamily N-acetyltransferase
MSTSELDIRTVEDPDSLVAWSAGQPYMSCELAAGELLSAYSATLAGEIVAVCFVKDSSNMRDQPWATVVGQPDASVALISACLADYPSVLDGGELSGCTIPRAAHEKLRTFLDRRGITWAHDGQGAPWDWWWTDTSPTPTPLFDKVRWLDTSNEAVASQIKDLLNLASPTHWAGPDNPLTSRWAGIVDSSGAVVSCAAETMRIAGKPHLASVATHPDHRGKGLALAVTGWLTQQLLQEFPIVTLGMHADNDSARTVYTKLGYHCDYSWFSSGFASMPASSL